MLLEMQRVAATTSPQQASFTPIWPTPPPTAVVYMGIWDSTQCFLPKTAKFELSESLLHRLRQRQLSRSIVSETVRCMSCSRSRTQQPNARKTIVTFFDSAPPAWLHRKLGNVIFLQRICRRNVEDQRPSFNTDAFQSTRHTHNARRLLAV